MTGEEADFDWDSTYGDLGGAPSDDTIITDHYSDYLEFLKLYCAASIDDIKYERQSSLIISYSDILSWDPDYADMVLYEPDKAIPYIKSALLSFLIVGNISDKKRTFYNSCAIRFKDFPSSILIRDLRENYINQFVQIEGLIRSASDVKPRILRSAWRCNRAQCGSINFVDQDTGPITKPDGCVGCNNTTNFTLVPRSCTLTNAQRLVVQERPEGLRGGELPKDIVVELTDDMCGITNAGGNVKVSGILRVFPSGSKDSPFFEYILEGSHLEISQKEYEDIELSTQDIEQIMLWAQDPDIYNILISSISPDIKGNENIKLAIAFQLFGGVSKKKPDGGRLRGEIHILLVTDPSCGKSQMMRYVVRLSPRGVITTGGGTSKAGLTCSAVKSELDGSWSLEAGAMVLADKGFLACISGKQILLTNNGLKQMDQITLDDRIASETGVWRKPTAIINKGIKSCINIKLYDGNTITCTPDHRILTYVGWREAKDLTPQDKVIIPVTHSGKVEVTSESNDYKRGWIFGFALCDMWINEESEKNGIGFSAALKNKQRTDYVLSLLNDVYSISTITRTQKGEKFSSRNIGGREITFSPSETLFFSSKQLKSDLRSLFSNHLIDIRSLDFEVGFLSAVLSTDCNISHKKGTQGIKHVIEISPTRLNKYGEEWGIKSCTLIQQMFQKFGVMATVKNNKVSISSLHSYNRVVEIWGDLLIGTKKERLYPIKGLHQVGSYDTILSQEMFAWVSQLPIKFQSMIDLGMASTWQYQIRKKREVRLDFLNRLYDHWDQILWEPVEKREIIKDYLMNPVLSIEENYEHEVYDLSFTEEHNFWIAGGIVHNCDEFDKMNADDRGAMHEALEDGTVTTAKAGICATLQARCSVLASANPDKGRFNAFVGVSEQIKMPPSLLSRFDLIFTMSDVAETTKDTDIASHILTVHRLCSMLECNLTIEDDELFSISPIISPDMFRKYVAYARQLPPPVLSADAEYVIKNYYINLRNKAAKQQKALPVTARQMEGMIRMAEAGARIRLSNVVTGSDATNAINMMDACLKGVAYDPETGDIDWDKMANRTSTSKRDKQRIATTVLRELTEDGGITTREAYLTAMIERKLPADVAEGLLEDLHREAVVTINKGKIRIIG